MKLTGTIGKCLIAGALACLCASEAAALDVVSLKNGSTIVGQIYQKDADGSLFMNLTDGSKRYVIVDEIADVSSNDEPFQVKTASESSNLKLNYSVYAAYEQNFQVSSGDSDFDVNDYLKSSPGFVLGVDLLLELKNRLCFMPAFELEFARLNSKSDGGVTSLYVNVPVQFAYKREIKKDISLLVNTGPVLGFCLAHNGSYGIEFVEGAHIHLEDEYRYISEYGSEYRYGNVHCNIFNCQWRIGAKVIYKRITAGLTYNIGLVDSSVDYHYYTEERIPYQVVYGYGQDSDYYTYRSYNRGEANFKRHSLMISVGAFF